MSEEGTPRRGTLRVFLGAAPGVGKTYAFAMFFGGRDSEGRPANPIVGIAVALLAPLAASLIQMAISRAREFEAAWLAGDLARLQGLAPPDEAELRSPAALRNQEALILLAAQASTLDGRAAQALTLMERLLAHWPDGHTPKRTRLRMEQVMAEVQLAAGLPQAARATAQGLVTMIEAAQGTSSQTYRAALSVLALAAARSADAPGAHQALARLAGLPVPPFSSAAERADIELRRAEALALLGRAEEACALAREVQAGEVGRLRLGFVGSTLFNGLSAWLQAFQASHPKVEVVVLELADEAQPQPAHFAGLDLPREGTGLLGAGEQGGGRAAEGLASRRQAHALAVAVEKPRTHAGLQLLDGHGQGRLRQAQALRRAAEVQRAREASRLERERAGR